MLLYVFLNNAIKYNKTQLCIIMFNQLTIN